MGGLNSALQRKSSSSKSQIDNNNNNNNNKQQLAQTLSGTFKPATADEAFEQMDLDNSGTLDEEELAEALSLVAASASTQQKQQQQQQHQQQKQRQQQYQHHPRDTMMTNEVFTGLASRLVSLYDSNGDGVVDREEYQCMVEDMAALRRAWMIEQAEREERQREKEERKARLAASSVDGGWRHTLKRMISIGLGRTDESDGKASTDDDTIVTEDDTVDEMEETLDDELALADMSLESEAEDSDGSILLSDLKVDLRRLFFGAFPWVKMITPGGPLILEPFTTTVTASFNREDIMESFLLDAGLRLLVARALRRRVRSFRDLVDGAVFYGRTWNMASKAAPFVEVPKLTNVEFDQQDRAIITGRARVRTSPDAPFIENAFKLRTRVGTRMNGQVIRLKDPELALILECPKNWERNIVSFCKKFNIPVPPRPEPLYTFFPLISPFKVTEQDGFNLGEDNCIKSIETKDGALRFEISAVIRPGRFLGNHYIAFTVPNRTFIVTMDRLKEGMRVARRNKRIAESTKRERETAERIFKSRRYREAVSESLSKRNLSPLASKQKQQKQQQLQLPKQQLAIVEENDDLCFAVPKTRKAEQTSQKQYETTATKQGFFGRFVDGYINAARAEYETERYEQLTYAISDWFGRQDTGSDDDDDDDASS